MVFDRRDGGILRRASTGSGNFTKQEQRVVFRCVLPVLMFSTLPDWMQASNSVARAMSPSSANSLPPAGNQSGIFDDNDNTTLSNGNFTGTLATDGLNPQEPITASGRGVALIAGQNFVFYIVDSNRVRFISTNGGMLSGDAVSQSNSIPASLNAINSSFAFSVGGSSPNGGLTRVGRHRQRAQLSARC
jgi:hypothetical protein